MAERRMFAKTIIDSDAFLDMPMSSQCLYFHLNMRADDDGFINAPKKIMRMVGASEDDLKLLIAKRFVLAFETGVIVIKHWRMHNLLRKDRYSPTQYQEEFHRLAIKENGAYTEAQNLLATNWQPDGNQTATQDSIGKDSIGKVSIESKPKRFAPPTIDEVRAYCKERNNGIDAEQFVSFYQSKNWMIGKNKMVDWRACVRTWEKKNNQTSENKSYDTSDLDRFYNNF